MPMSVTEKILARAAGQAEVKPGELAVVDVETAVLMDMTFLPEGWREVLHVHDPSKVVIAFDHLVPASTVYAATAHRTGRRFAAHFGIERLHDVGLDQGIAHAVVADRGYAIPGTVLVNGDSRTWAAGAFNCAARGFGGLICCMPDVVRLSLRGDGRPSLTEGSAPDPIAREAPRV